jgi:tetratricopeptide (TPR) repeat protein
MRASAKRRAARVVVGLSLAVNPVGTVVATEPVGSAGAQQAIALCDAVDDRPTAAASAQLARAFELAQQAVAADDHDAKAHLAVFCTVAKQTSIAGFSVRSLLAVRRLHREIDRTLELAPDYTDALIAKGAFLLNLPRLLGGDAREAERLLRRALEFEPDRISARVYLAEALATLGFRDAAHIQAEQALAAALSAGRQPQAEEVRQLIARLAE